MRNCNWQAKIQRVLSIILCTTTLFQAGPLPILAYTTTPPPPRPDLAAEVGSLSVIDDSFSPAQPATSSVEPTPAASATTLTSSPPSVTRPDPARSPHLISAVNRFWSQSNSQAQALAFHPPLLNLPPTPPGFSGPLAVAATLPPESPAALTSLSLVPGWNLISLPEQLSSTNPATVLASIEGKYSQVYAYNGCDAADPWKLYDPADPANSDLTTIDHTMGLWIEMTEVATLEVAGTTPSQTTLQLCSGWNLIGYPLKASLSVPEALVSIEGRYERIFTWDPMQTADPWEFFDLDAPSWANQVQTMEPGRGYWLLATEDTLLTLSLPTSPREMEIPGFIGSPENLSTVSGQVPIVLADEANLHTITVDYWPVNNLEAVQVLVAGVDGSGGETIATLDTTVLANGSYVIRVAGTDENGDRIASGVMVTVEGEYKPGRVRFTVNDLTVPVVGLPIQIDRTYDSLERNERGDFGYGWSLSIANPKLEVDPDHNVTLTMPDGKRVTFYYNPQFILAFGIPQYTPKPGVYGSLTANSCGLVVVSGGQYFCFPGGPYQESISTYTYTDPYGREYRIGIDGTLKSIKDLNENLLTFNKDGITSSAGDIHVDFVRDVGDRITQITDMLGNTITYTYDERGDLVSVTDQEENTTQLTYKTGHILSEMIDPRGIVALQNEYDSEGRVITSIDADGNQIEYTYDISDRQEFIRDRRGNITLYVYDDDGRVLSQTDPLGHTTTFTYDAQGNELSKADNLGDTTTNTYDSQGNRLSQTDALGNTVVWTYNSRNQLLTQTDNKGNVVTSTYDTRGNLLSTTNAFGKKMTHTYDARGNRLSTTDAEGNTFEYEYNFAGNKIKSIDPLGNTTTYTYDGNGNQLTETITRTDADGNVITMTTQRIYDNKNQIIKEIDPSGNVVETEYNSIGKETATIKNGVRTEFEYDARGNRIRTVYPDGTDEVETYDTEGYRVGFTDRAGNTTTYEYDALNRIVRMIHPDDQTVQQEYDAVGNKTAQIDENGNRTSYEYDAIGRTTKVIDPLGNATIYTYDANGNKTSMVDAMGNTTRFEYDVSNNRTKTIFPDETSISLTYDKLDRKITEIDQAENTIQFEYDAFGRLTKVTDALNGETSYSYDEVGNKLTQTDANGHTTRWTYDNLGRTTSRTLPLGMTETFSYDSNGNILTYTDFNGQTTKNIYDINDRLLKTIYPDNSEINYTYTPMGQLKTVMDYQGTTTYHYDQRYRLQEVIHPDGSSLSYTYDAVGNRLSVVAPAGTTSYTYDPLNRLSTVTDSDGGVTGYSYDTVGNRTGMTYPNGTVTSYTYDDLNRLTYLENKKSTGEAISSYAYTLGPAGNRLRVVENTGRQVDYTYDVLFRLIEEKITTPGLSEQTISYTYDFIGNRLTKTDANDTINYTYDANDRLLTENSIVYTYDDNGNTLSKVDGLDITTYAYDFESRLISATTPDHIMAFGYDVDGVKISASIDGVEINYLVDKNRDFAQVLEEREANGTLLANFTHGDDLISQKRDGLISFYHYDGLGSSRVLTDNEETVTDTYTYEAFGNLIHSTGNTINAYLFTGEQYDANIGFYYLRARYYNPTAGRFITMDTFPGSVYDPISLHKYLYTHANPINATDPSGLTIALERGIDYVKIAAQMWALIKLGVMVAVAVCTVSSIISGFTALGSGNPCDFTNFNVFAPAMDTFLTTYHITEAISHNPGWTMLHYISPKHDRKWLSSDPRCKKDTLWKKPLWCDEYPFASAQEGGQANNPSLRLLPGWEQQIQGGKLSRFYTLCNVVANDPTEGAYMVSVIAAPETTWLCK